jgi:late competence protein required for DNA uptake (superfamily II DNA/RNA helicase)
MEFYRERFYCGHCGRWAKVEHVYYRRGKLYHSFCGYLVRVVPRKTAYRQRFHERARRGEVLVGVELYKFLTGGAG